MLELDKLHGIVKHIADGFQSIVSVNRLSWKNFMDKLTLLEEAKEGLKSRPRGALQNDGAEQFTNMEFFKSNFFDKKLDEDKMARIFQAKDVYHLKRRIAQRF